MSSENSNDQTPVLDLLVSMLERVLGAPSLRRANAVGWTLADGVSVGVGIKGSRDASGDVAYAWMAEGLGPEWLPHKKYAAGEGRANTIEDLPGLDRAHAADRFELRSRSHVEDFVQHLMRQYPLAVRDWRIARTGRPWRGDEALFRFYLAPEKIEMCDGRLFWSDAQRVTMLALLIENVGVDQVLRIGDAAVWREAVRAIDSGTT